MPSKPKTTKEQKQKQNEDKQSSKNRQAFACFFSTMIMSLFGKIRTSSSYKRRNNANKLMLFTLHDIISSNQSISCNIEELLKDDFREWERIKDDMQMQKMKEKKEKKVSMQSEMKRNILLNAKNDLQSNSQHQNQIIVKKAIALQQQYFIQIIEEYFDCSVVLKKGKKNAQHSQFAIQKIVFADGTEEVNCNQFIQNIQYFEELENAINLIKDSIEKEDNYYIFDYKTTWNFNEGKDSLTIFKNGNCTEIHCPHLCSLLVKMITHMKGGNFGQSGLSGISGSSKTETEIHIDEIQSNGNERKEESQQVNEFNESDNFEHFDDIYNIDDFDEIENIEKMLNDENYTLYQNEVPEMNENIENIEEIDQMEEHYENYEISDQKESNEMNQQEIIYINGCENQIQNIQQIDQTYQIYDQCQPQQLYQIPQQMNQMNSTNQYYVYQPVDYICFLPQLQLVPFQQVTQIIPQEIVPQIIMNYGNGIIGQNCYQLTNQQQNQNYQFTFQCDNMTGIDSFWGNNPEN